MSSIEPQMQTYREIKLELERLKACDLKSGDWVWLKAFEISLVGKPNSGDPLPR